MRGSDHEETVGGNSTGLEAKVIGSVSHIYVKHESAPNRGIFYTGREGSISPLCCFPCKTRGTPRAGLLSLLFDSTRCTRTTGVPCAGRQLHNAMEVRI